jgi:CO/xanthine dehydrogenase Mo-binding subunit
MGASQDTTENVFGATLSRGRFVKGTGALIVGLSMPAAFAASSAADAGATSLDPSQSVSWVQVNPDGTVAIRTGYVEMGNGTAVAYRQLVAEELNVPFEAITKMTMGSTDTTPDPGGINGGVNSAANLRKVAAYTYQALLSLASTQLAVPVANLTVTNGVVSGGGKTVSYGDLVKNQQLNLTIPVSGSPSTLNVTVTGTPPLKPVSQYTIIGQSYPNPYTTDFVSGATTWVANVVLPDMLHARVVRPPTLGSTVISVGQLDKKAFPNTQVVVKGNLVAVLDPQEYVAIEAAALLGRATKWTDWQGLPGSGNLASALEKADYTLASPVNGANNKGDVNSAFAGAAKTIAAQYLTPVLKQAPIGPSVALAWVQSSGRVDLWMHSQAPGIAQKMVSQILNTPISNVVVHWMDGSGTYGRSNPGPDGAEADAVILSQAVGRPVRVQWMRPEDMQWAVSSFPILHNMKVGLDASGKMIAIEGNYYHAGRFDGRGLGALLAGMPPGATDDGTPSIPQKAGHYSWVASIATQPGVYDKVPNVYEYLNNTAPFGQISSPYKVGMRIHSMRTPDQRQENFALESIVNEAAAAAGVDPIQYRLEHTSDPNLIEVLTTLQQAHGWQTRPSPNPHATTAGSTLLNGQGMGVMLRSKGYHAAAADVTVNPKTGKVSVSKYTIVYQGGIVVNPRRVKRYAENGATQGLSEVLKETTSFDTRKITSADWVTYPIIRMVELPKINAVILQRMDLGYYGQGSEGFNSGPYMSVPAAVFDATGKFPRFLPLRPANMRALLAG